MWHGGELLSLKLACGGGLRTCHPRASLPEPLQDSLCMWQVSRGRSKFWARYDARVEAVLDAGAAGPIESMLRTMARRSLPPVGTIIYEAQVHGRARGKKSQLVRHVLTA